MWGSLSRSFDTPQDRSWLMRYWQKLANDLQPFSVVEDKGFRKCCHALNSMPVLPIRKSVPATSIPGIYGEARSSLWEGDENVSVVCLTIDCWASKTMHHLIYISYFPLQWTIQKVDHEVTCWVSDNAANIIRAIQTLKWTHHSYLAHTISLIVKDVLKDHCGKREGHCGIPPQGHRSCRKAYVCTTAEWLPPPRPKQDCVTFGDRRMQSNHQPSNQRLIPLIHTLPPTGRIRM